MDGASLPPRRIPAIDYVKATAIVAVVSTHAGPPFWSPQFTAWDFALRQTWVSFHVPAFLVVAGLLYARASPLGVRDTGRRLARVLVPYAIATGIVYLLGVEDPPRQPLLVALATGSALGIYYFVFALTVCIIAAWAISRLDTRGLIGLVSALAGF